MAIEIRRLQEDDAAALWKLRLRALETDPHAFGESAEEHGRRSIEEFRRQLASEGRENFVLGALDSGALVGMAGFYREKRTKRRHKGGIWGVFVSPEARGKGVGRQLMVRLLEDAQAQEGLTSIHLTVCVTQTYARALYRSLGFRCFGVEPRALMIADEYLDEEHMLIELNPTH
jgi:ribosomal protein S18 acetylase RimI-like enzyme